MRRFPVLILALLLAPACETTRVKSPVAVPAVARVAQAQRLWEVRAEPGGEPRGYVVWFRSPSAEQDSHHVVRNRWHQDLGLIDGLGRAYRYLPHEEEARWVGSGTVTQGVGRILGLDDPELVEQADFAAGPARAMDAPAPAQVLQSARTTSGPEEGSS